MMALETFLFLVGEGLSNFPFSLFLEALAATGENRRAELTGGKRRVEAARGFLTAPAGRLTIGMQPPCCWDQKRQSDVSEAQLEGCCGPEFHMKWGVFIIPCLWGFSWWFSRSSQQLWLHIYPDIQIKTKVQTNGFLGHVKLAVWLLSCNPCATVRKGAVFQACVSNAWLPLFRSIPI